LWPVGVVVGLVSERSAFGWDDFTRWIPDLVVGLVFVGCGAHAMVVTGPAAEPTAENRTRGGSKKRTGHDAGASTISYGRSHRVPERSRR
jgi:hypothetical protein